MKYVTAVLILTLTSINASIYANPEHQLLQTFMSGNSYENVMPLDVKGEEFLGKSSTDELTNWDSPQDFQNLVTNILVPLEKVQDERKDTKIKRMKTSLSIDNPLDVLRQQYYRALARRMKFKSIEKNREHLIKTGKRTDRIANLRTYLGKRSDFSVSEIEKNKKRIGLEENEKFAGKNNYEIINQNIRKNNRQTDGYSYQT